MDEGVRHLELFLVQRMLEEVAGDWHVLYPPSQSDVLPSELSVHIPQRVLQVHVSAIQKEGLPHFGSLVRHRQNSIEQDGAAGELHSWLLYVFLGEGVLCLQVEVQLLEVPRVQRTEIYIGYCGTGLDVEAEGGFIPAVPGILVAAYAFRKGTSIRSA